MKALKTILAIAPMFLVACNTVEIPGEPDGSDSNADASDDSVASDGESGLHGTFSSPLGFGPAVNVYSQMIDPVPAADDCTGNTIELGLDQWVGLSGTTLDANDDTKEWCGDSSETTAAPDVVFNLVLSSACSLHFALDEGGTSTASSPSAPRARPATRRIPTDSSA